MSIEHALFYPMALALISILVTGLEWAFGHRKQAQLRPRLLSDALHLVFNGHFLGLVLVGLASSYVLPWVDHVLARWHLTDAVHRNAAAAWPVWLQIIVALVVVDFLQWCVHNALHRSSWLWEFHKTHHSVVDGEMDWIVSFRFQWTEVVVYRAVLYLPLAWFGFGPEAIMFHAVFGTLIGHLNHANLGWDYGPFRYVLNNPPMHIWHHDYEGDARTTVNFGIIFSTWDYLFGTARVPDRPPARLGFAGVEQFPRNFFSQMAWPLNRLVPERIREGFSSLLGLAILVGAYWAATAP